MIFLPILEKKKIWTFLLFRLILFDIYGKGLYKSLPLEEQGQPGGGVAWGRRSLLELRALQSESHFLFHSSAENVHFKLERKISLSQNQRTAVVLEFGEVVPPPATTPNAPREN